MIEVEKKNDDEYIVIIEEGNDRSKHTVNLDDAYYQKLTDGKTTKEELIKKSFKFLLERESKESILPEFNLRIIGKYFPEYESKINGRYGAIL